MHSQFFERRPYRKIEAQVFDSVHELIDHGSQCNQTGNCFGDAEYDRFIGRRFRDWAQFRGAGIEAHREEESNTDPERRILRAIMHEMTAKTVRFGGIPGTETPNNHQAIARFATRGASLTCKRLQI